MDTQVSPDIRLLNWFSPDNGLPVFSSINPADATAVIRQLIDEHRQQVEQWLEMHKQLKVSGKPSNAWDFVVLEEHWSDAIARAWAPISHLQAVADNDKLREAYRQCLEMLTEHQTWRSQNRAIYQLFAELQGSAEFDSLSAEQQRVVELELRDFHLAGVDLDEDDRVRYAKIVMRMSALGAEFQENLLDATNSWNLHIEDANALQGLPAAELRLLQAKAAAKEQAGWLIDLSYPSYSAILTYAENRDLRQQVYHAFVTRASELGPNAGTFDNSRIIDELLSLRHQLAQLLEFPEYSSYALVPRMAESPDTVMDFLQRLATRALPAARQQFADLQEFAREQGADVPLQAWDLAFWSERYRSAELDLSDEILKPYFPLQSMLHALTDVAAKVFGLHLTADESVETWHPDVHFYWIQDHDGARIAGLYMDMYTRPVKRGGAWMDICQSRRLTADGLQLPVAFLNCNFPPPQEDTPACSLTTTLKHCSTSLGTACITC